MLKHDQIWVNHPLGVKQLSPSRTPHRGPRGRDELLDQVNRGLTLYHNKYLVKLTSGNTLFQHRTAISSCFVISGRGDRLSHEYPDIYLRYLEVLGICTNSEISFAQIRHHFLNISTYFIQFLFFLE